MCESYREVLISKRVYLTEELLMSHLYDNLLSEGVITTDMKDVIDSKGPNFEKVGMFLDILATLGPSLYEKFCKVLLDTQNDHVVAELRNCETTQHFQHLGLSKTRSVALRSSYDYVRDNMMLEFVMKYLLQRKVLSVHEKDVVESKQTSKDKNDYVLQLLLRKSDRQFDDFVLSHRDCGYGNIADRLEERVGQNNLNKDDGLDVVEECQPIKTNIVEDDWMKSQLTRKQRRKPVTERLLSCIAENVSPDQWRRLGVEMEISQGRMEQIRMENQYSAHNQVQKLFVIWLNKHGRDATIENLLVLLRKTDLPEKDYRSLVLEECYK